MGILDVLDSLDLSDDQKAQLRREHEEEIGNVTSENQRLKASSKKSNVDTEIEALSNMGFDEAPGLLKFVRRVWLSDDGEPGLILLSDDEMNLSDDDKTGANSREEITTAGAIRKFIELMPKTEEGKLKIALSDQHIDTHGKPPAVGDENNQENKDEQARSGLSDAIGVEVRPRTRSRYMRGGHKVTAGGDE